MKTRKYEKGTTVAQARPFVVCETPGALGVRIGKQRPIFSADEVFITAPASITLGLKGLEIRGEGVVRRRGRTIAITS